MDDAYLERANGRFEIWTYSDGRRVYVWRGNSLADAYQWATRNEYDLKMVTQ